MLRAGALGFKCFLVDSGVDEFPPLDEAGLAAALSAISDTEAPLLVHAELPGPLARADAALAASALRDPRSYLRYLRSRPPEAEDEAVALVAATAAATGGRAHIVHLSSAGSLATLRRARDRGVRLSAETTPHYLVFAAEQVPDGATPFKCAPPIREEENRIQLWDGLADGTVEMVVTDHSPCTPELKRLGDGDLAAAWGGIASLELGLAAVWTEARERGFDLARVVDWLCARPAALAGLSGRKGAIEVGCDADLVVLDPDASFVVDPARLHHRHPVTPYAGAQLHGRVVATILGGSPAYLGDAALAGGPGAALAAAVASVGSPVAGGFVGAPRGRWLRGSAA
jgi:allantoinase